MPTPSESWLTRLRAGFGHALGNRAVRRIFVAHAAALTCAAMISPDRGHLGQGGHRRRQQRLRHRAQRLGRGHPVTGLSSSGSGAALPVVTRIPLAAGTMGVGYVVMALASSLPVGALGCFIGGIGNGFYFVSLIQAIQDRTADEFQGRVMGLLESTTAGCYGVGFLLAGAITALTSVRVTFAATAVGVILATVWMATLLRGTPPSRCRVARREPGARRRDVLAPRQREAVVALLAHRLDGGGAQARLAGDQVVEAAHAEGLASWPSRTAPPRMTLSATISVPGRESRARPRGTRRCRPCRRR